MSTDRRRFLTYAGVLGIVSVAAGVGVVKLASTYFATKEDRSAMKSSQEQLLYIGTYASKDEQSIYSYRMNTRTGAITPAGSFSGVDNPSFLIVDRRRHYLYAVSETQTFAGQRGGAVASLTISPQDGSLTLLNIQPTNGADPCHLAVDATDSFLVACNYSSGSVSLFPLHTNGEIAPLSQLLQHTGHGPNPDRQEAPHTHCVLFVPQEESYALVTDLGLDTIFTYAIDRRTQKLVEHGKTQVKAGSGPRHLAFSPSGRFVYLINELANTIVTFTFDENNVILHPLQTKSTLPPGFTGQNTAAEIQVAPSGKFLYGSNRGHDSIVVFAIDDESGILSYVEHVSTQGKNPRHFTLTPDGHFLLAANQDSDSIVIYSVNTNTGRLTPTGTTLSLPKPVCIKFFV